MLTNYKLFLSAVTIASLSLVACGQMKEKNEGRPAVEKPPGAATAPTTSGSGAAVASTAKVPVSSGTLTVTVSKIQGNTGVRKDVDVEISSSLSINGTEYPMKTGSGLSSLGGGDNMLATINYLETPEYVATYQGRCSAECNQYYITVWLTSKATGANVFQIGVMKDLFNNQINLDEASDQIAISFVGQNFNKQTYVDNMMSFEAMNDLLFRSSAISTTAP